jgi:transcriptional regulator with XRE-family HTH domain
MGEFTALNVDAMLGRHKLTREDFCEQMSLSMNTIRAWQRGDRRPSLEVCQLACERLNISKHELRPDVWPPPTSRSKRSLAAA